MPARVAMGIAALHPSYTTTLSPLTISARLPAQGFQHREILSRAVGDD